MVLSSIYSQSKLLNSYLDAGCPGDEDLLRKSYGAYWTKLINPEDCRCRDLLHRFLEEITGSGYYL